MTVWNGSENFLKQVASRSQHRESVIVKVSRQIASNSFSVAALSGTGISSMCCDMPGTLSPPWVSSLPWRETEHKSFLGTPLIA